MPTSYRVTLCRKDADGVPVITPFNIHKKQYEQIMTIIHKVHGGKGEMQR